MPNNNATRNAYRRTAYNLYSNRNYYNQVMRVMNPNSMFKFVANTRKPNNKYTAFKSGNKRYVLTSDGYLFMLPNATKNLKKLNKAVIVANMLHGIQRH